MKKFLSTAFAAVMLASGFVALSGGSSTALEPGYPGTVDTTCIASAANKPRFPKHPKADFRVGTGGNGAANGQVTFQYHKNHTVVREFQFQYEGPGYTTYRMGRVPVGRYKVTVFFNSKPVDSVYQNCRTSFSQTVRPGN